MFCKNVSKGICGKIFLMAQYFFLSLQRNQLLRRVIIAERPESTKICADLVNVNHLTINYDRE